MDAMLELNISVLTTIAEELTEENQKLIKENQKLTKKNQKLTTNTFIHQAPEKTLYFTLFVNRRWYLCAVWRRTILMVIPRNSMGNG
ncbi:23759_t:CDS:2 [Entrophospora sp. SA101]|nr:23759_t:CDS:2 [Entrophospora sp. SA101]